MAASVGLSGVGMGAQFGMVSPILAIDPIIDMARTMINVTGSLTNALVVDKLMGNLNMDAYNDMSERIVGARSAEQSGINAKTKKKRRVIIDPRMCLADRYVRGFFCLHLPARNCGCPVPDRIRSVIILRILLKIYLFPLKSRKTGQLLIFLYNR